MTGVTWWAVSGVSLLSPEELADLKPVGNNSLFPWQLEDKGIQEVQAKGATPLPGEDIGDLVS